MCKGARQCVLLTTRVTNYIIRLLAREYRGDHGCQFFKMIGGAMIYNWGCPVQCTRVVQKHQLWKLKASRVVSHAFEHAEIDGARNIDLNHV